MNENIVTNTGGKKAFFTVKKIIQIFSLFCIALALCPSFLVSCEGSEAKIDVTTAIRGVPMSDELREVFGGTSEWISEPHISMLLCLLIPLFIFILLFFKKLGDKRIAAVIIGCTAVDFVMWLVFRANTKKIAEAFLCTFEITGWYVINLIVMILIILLSILVVINRVRFDTDLIALFSGGGIRNTYNQMPDIVNQISGDVTQMSGNTAAGINNTSTLKESQPVEAVVRIEEPALKKEIEQEKGNGTQINKTAIIAIAVAAVIAIGAVAGALVYIRTQQADTEKEEIDANMQVDDKEEKQQKKEEVDTEIMQTEKEEAEEADEAQNTAEEPQNNQKTEPQVIQLDSRYIKSIRASSELTDSTKTYKAESVLDGNRETCWSEGASGTGEGEAIYIAFTTPVYITEVDFLNGYVKDETVYNANGKIKRAELVFDEDSCEAEFNDWQYQEIENSLYSDRLALNAPVRTQTLSITITEAQKGTKYDDICLTELALWGYVENVENADNTASFDAALSEGIYAWSSGSNEDMHGADITISYESDGSMRLTGEAWNSVENATINAVSVSANADGSVRFIGNGILSEFDGDKQLSNIVLEVSAPQQNEVRITQSGETGSVTFAGTYQAAGGEEAADIYGIYGDVILDTALIYGSDCEYALYDMDHDGTEELIVSWGTSDADWANTVYTVDDSGVLVEVGTFYGVVSLYAAENGNGIYSVYGHMDYQEVEWIIKNGEALSAETVLSGETMEYYENDNPIRLVGVDMDIADY